MHQVWHKDMFQKTTQSIKSICCIASHYSLYGVLLCLWTSGCILEPFILSTACSRDAFFFFRERKGRTKLYRKEPLCLFQNFSTSSDFKDLYSEQPLWQARLTWLLALKLSLTFLLQRLFTTMVLALILVWEVFPWRPHWLLSYPSEHNTQISNIYICSADMNTLVISLKDQVKKLQMLRFTWKKYLNRTFENIKNVTDNSPFWGLFSFLRQHVHVLFWEFASDSGK